MGSKARRALEVGRVARQGKLLRVRREVGVVGDRPAASSPRDGHAEGGRRADRPRRARAPGAVGRQQAGAAIIIAALLVASALMARVNDAVAVVGFALSVGLGLYELWRIFRTPGDL